MSEDTTVEATPETQATTTPETTLNDFEDQFFNRVEAPQEETPAQVEEPSVEEPEATVPDQEDTPPEPKKKKSAQERINELTAKSRAAEREAEALRQRLAAIESSRSVETEPTTTPVQTDEAPSPDALNPDGTQKYEFGQFDPAFLKDWTEYSFKQQELLSEKRRVEAAEAAARQAEEEVLQAEKAELQAAWTEKVQTFVTENEDFQAKAAELVDSLNYVDPQLGEQMALAVLTLENGPEVLYHLANNPEEAHSLVNGGLAKVLMGLGALDGKFKKTATPPAPKTSKAPTPPPTNRGSNGQFISSDPNSLEAFEKKFFAA